MEQVRGIWLVLCVSAAWVGTSQFARAAEMRAEQLQHCSIVLLMTWANTMAWVFLAIPHALKKVREANTGTSDGAVVGAGCCPGRSSFLPPAFRNALHTEAFSARQPPKFLAIALFTNLCYVAALHFLPASLNTAVFCTSPIFTLLFSATWLPREGDGVRDLAGELFSWKGLSVVLSVFGVLLISEPWRAVAVAAAQPHEALRGPLLLLQPDEQYQAGDPLERIIGVILSLLAGLGTAVYQVYFKLTFGDRMGPEEVGLFLAHMGASSTFLMGSVVLVAAAVHPVRLDLVPWGLVGATAASSALFNFLIKFGLSVDSPVGMSLATQVGIPLNLLIDVVVVHANVGLTQAIGTLVMLVSFTLQQFGDGRARGVASAGVMNAKLLDASEREL